MGLPASKALRATTVIEIEIALTGTYAPGYPATGPSYACGGTPAEPDGVDDTAIAEIGEVHADRGPNGFRGWIVTSLLEGIDRNSDAYRQLCTNLLKVLGHEAERALLAEVEFEEAV